MHQLKTSLKLAYFRTKSNNCPLVGLQNKTVHSDYSSIWLILVTKYLITSCSHCRVHILDKYACLHKPIHIYKKKFMQQQNCK